MGCMLTRANGVHRQAPQALHRLQHPLPAPETLMKRPSGWYTFLGGCWVWAHRRKGKYFALIAGEPDYTEKVNTIEELEEAIIKKAHHHDKESHG